MRLKRPTKIYYKGEEIRVDKLVNKAVFSEKRNVVKVKKNKQVLKTFELSILEVEYSLLTGTKIMFKTEYSSDIFRMNNQLCLEF